MLGFHSLNLFVECRHVNAYLLEIEISPFIVLQCLEVPFAVVNIISQNDVIFLLLVKVIIDNSWDRFKP